MINNILGVKWGHTIGSGVAFSLRQSFITDPV